MIERVAEGINLAAFLTFNVRHLTGADFLFTLTITVLHFLRGSLSASTHVEISFVRLG